MGGEEEEEEEEKGDKKGKVRTPPTHTHTLQQRIQKTAVSFSIQLTHPPTHQPLESLLDGHPLLTRALACDKELVNQISSLRTHLFERYGEKKSQPPTHPI